MTTNPKSSYVGCVPVYQAHENEIWYRGSILATACDAKTAAEIAKVMESHGDLLAGCSHLVNVHGTIPTFMGSVFLEHARDEARRAVAKWEHLTQAERKET